jgi:hypothetical protein
VTIGTWSGRRWLRSHGESTYVERVGRGERRPLAPAACCEQCDCRLSRYRAQDEERCWACAHAAVVEELSQEERELRVTLLVQGRPLPITPDPAYRCPRCGGIKLAGSARCAGCRYRADHPKKPRAGEALKGGPCPACGGEKTPRSHLCRACHYADQRLLFANNPAITCPDCGGTKVRKATRCRKCRNRHDYGTVYDGARPRNLCPDCGGPKKLRRARRCRDCARRAHRESNRSLEPALAG